MAEIPNINDKVIDIPPIAPKPVPTQILRRPQPPSVEDNSLDLKRETKIVIPEEPYRRNGRSKKIKRRKGKPLKTAFL